MDRIIALVDMDCFYVQVEQRLQPEYKGKPCAVVQYKTWKGGGYILILYLYYFYTKRLIGLDSFEVYIFIIMLCRQPVNTLVYY
jgi:hypothetical protein